MTDTNRRMSNEEIAEITACFSLEYAPVASKLLQALHAERERVEELEAHGLCRCADEVRCDMRKLITACEPYLKDGETPAECIQRNRDDTGAVMKLLEKEKRKYDALVDGIKNLPRYYIETTYPMMDKGPSIRWNVRKGGEWVRDHQLRALLEDDDD